MIWEIKRNKTYSTGAERAGEIMDITRTSVATREACIACRRIKVYWNGFGLVGRLDVEQRECELHTH
jgi:hypothetical protein